MNNETRQQFRAGLRARWYERYRVAPNAKGTKANPILPRKERRILARAFAIGEIRTARGAAILGEGPVTA